MNTFLYMISGALYTSSLKHLSKNGSAASVSVQLCQILLPCFSKTLYQFTLPQHYIIIFKTGLLRYNLHTTKFTDVNI